MAGAKKTGYKKKTATTYKKKAPARKRQTFDGRTLLANAYFEVNQTGNDERAIAYAIRCDPNELRVMGTRAGANLATTDGLKVHDGTGKADGSGTFYAEGTKLPCLMYDREKTMWRLYRVNSITVKITVDAKCKDNPVVCLQDYGDFGAGAGGADMVPASYANCMAQPHKSHIITDSRRVITYGHKCSTAEERDWVTSLQSNKTTFIKIFQQLEPEKLQSHDGNTLVPIQSTCVHRVEVLFNMSFKDRTNPL